MPVDKIEACKYYKRATNKNYFFFGLLFYGHALAHGVGINEFIFFRKFWKIIVNGEIFFYDTYSYW